MIEPRVAAVARAALAAAILFHAGCSVAPKRAAIARDPATLQSWQASGRMAVSGAETGGSGSFTWTQTDGAAVVQLRGPVGVGSVRLTLDDRSIRIETGDGQSLQAEDARAELAARLGAEVPAQALRYWLRGLAAPSELLGEHEWQHTADGAMLKQDAWRIDYRQFSVTDGVRLPTRLVAASGPAKVRIVVDRWRLK